MRQLVTVLVAIVAMAGVAMYGPAAAEASSVWACAPVTQANAGANNLAVLTIYNGSVTTANVAAKWLTKVGVNLAGVTVPGSAATYPGETGANTVAVPAGNTRIVPWTTPLANGTLDGNVVAAIRVVSDVPVVVGMQNVFGAGSMPVLCSPLD